MATITQRHKTGNPYEDKFGYSRAIRKGPFIFVSGTTSIDSSTGNVLYPKSAYDQTLKAFSEIVLAIEALGGRKDDVVRVRLFVTDHKDSEGVSKALKEAFGHLSPAATLVFGVSFVSSDMRVEVEADALVI
ncbi:YjgF-like protein [Crepidotus variabilis]|uniref:YjgF-like protein n=1 Tax=Crepidotus variabilis TaxID=179855 RepID=A0A9P6EAC6_9AGAR|nr:YjgF-like protein [Crepidotus variabilis]